MLRYFNHGFRRAKDSPVPLSRRANWEFYAILAGTCSLTTREGGEEQTAAPAVWIFRPRHLHGWRGIDRKWEAAVFHYSIVPSAFDEWFGADDAKLVRLNDVDAADIRSRLAEVRQHYEEQKQDSPIVLERILCELCLIVMRHSTLESRATMSTANAKKITDALSWFESQLSENPKVEAAAQALHVSTSHLRRLFREVMDKSPKQAFDAVRIRRAKELMVESTETLEQIAGKSGFLDANELCRAFRRMEKSLTPAKWRKRILAVENDLPALRREVGVKFQE